MNLLQGRDEIRPEDRGIVVAWIERYPARRRHRVECICMPPSHERRLSETGGRNDDRQFLRGSLTDCANQPGTWNEAGSRPRDMELGLEELDRCARTFMFS